MMATRLKMIHFGSLMKIDEIYIEGEGWYRFAKKEEVHHYVTDHPDKIFVDIPPYPTLIPVTSCKGEKFVRSKADGSKNDNLMKLPCE